MFVDLVIENANLALVSSSELNAPLGQLLNASLAIHEGNIVAIWQPGQHTDISSSNIVNAEGKWLLPGFIDCHTHLVFAGNRADEYTRRARGESYEQIARAGGGILSTVNATRLASEDELLEQSLTRARALLNQGVTHLEIKSGYGLNWETEAKMLRVAQRIGQSLGIDISCTYLGAHALPLEYRDNREAYVDLICRDHLPKIAKQQLADCVDMFCESIGFSQGECERIINTARSLNLKVKAHAEQLTRAGGAELMAKYQGLSADHIEHISRQDAQLMGENNVVGVLLPGAYYTLKDTHQPPIEWLREFGVAMAVATDLNPGSSPIGSLLLAANMAVTLFQLSTEEALSGITLNAAKALGVDSRKGSIQVGKQADLCLWDIRDPAQLIYEINLHKPLRIWQKGKELNQ